MTPWSMEIFAESVNQPVTTSLDSKLVKAAAYARGMREGSIITLPVDTKLFSTEMAIYLECNDLERFIGHQEISVSCICLYMK